MSEPKRITERGNDLTASIDAGSAEDILTSLARSDAQIFEGYEDYDAIGSQRICDTIKGLIKSAGSMLTATISGKEDNVVVFSGCGTSGRMAWLCAREFNQVLQSRGMPACFRYCISGGDEALIVSKELPEDSPTLGVRDLQHHLQAKDRAMVVGITCGLSAPYVAGQLDWTLTQDQFVPCLLGFNPVSIARNDAVENWTKTCHQIFSAVEEAAAVETVDGCRKAYVLNPVVGPEPITGSTRMKGGSATKILLEVVFLQAIEQALQARGHDKVASGASGENGSSCTEPGPEKLPNPSPPLSSSEAVSLYQQACAAVYRSSKAVAELVRGAAQCISQTDGHLYYLGSHSFALLGLIDASEMVDTYGAARDEVRGFVENGWQKCDNNQGDLSSIGTPFRMSVQHFEADLLPKLTEKDMVILLSGQQVTGRVKSTWSQVVRSPAKLGHVIVSSSASPGVSSEGAPATRPCPVAIVSVNFAEAAATFCPAVEEFSMKLVLNAITTGANVMKGRVFGNTMINLSVSNNKLYFRSVSIVKSMTGVQDDVAVHALHRSVYREDPAALEQAGEKPISDHIRAAKHQPMVVPLAVLLATESYRGSGLDNVRRALKHLSSGASLRHILQACRRSSGE